MSDRTETWNVWTSAAGMLRPFRDVLGSVRTRRALDTARREHLLDTPPHCADAELLDRVAGRLAADQWLDDSDIHVESVYDGVVRLGGTAATDEAHVRAFDDVASVPGVRRVASEVITRDGVSRDAQDAA